MHTCGIHSGNPVVKYEQAGLNTHPCPARQKPPGHPHKYPPSVLEQPQLQGLLFRAHSLTSWHPPAEVSKSKPDGHMHLQLPRVLQQDADPQAWFPAHSFSSGWKKGAEIRTTAQLKIALYLRRNTYPHTGSTGSAERNPADIRNEILPACSGNRVGTGGFHHIHRRL